MQENELKYPVQNDLDRELFVSERQSNPIREKSLDFALDIIRLYKEMEKRKEFIISKQLLRSGTGIGANVEEATAAESRRDFAHKLNIASKEARETLYWLRLLDRSDLVPGLDVTDQLSQADELVRILTAIVKTAGSKT